MEHPMTYWRLFYHVVWSTKNRLPVIDERIEAILARAVPGIAREHGCWSHAIGIMPEHMHLAISIPPRLAIADAIKTIKGSSSHLLAHELADGSDTWVGWQNEYGIVSFSEKTLPIVVEYVTHQREHHANGTLITGLEREERDRTNVTV